MNGCNNNNNKINQVREKAKFYLKSNFPSKLNLSFYCTSLSLYTPPLYTSHIRVYAALKILYFSTGQMYIYIPGLCVNVVIYNLVKTAQRGSDRRRRRR